MNLYLAQSVPGGWGGVGRTVDSMRLYGVLPGGVLGKGAMSVPQQAAARVNDMKLHLAAGSETKSSNSDVTTIAEGINVHLAKRDPQHHDWPNRGVEKQGLKLRILLSYWYYKDVDLDALFAKYFTRPYPDVFADSGAYSAWSLGGDVDLGQYIEWLHAYKHLFTSYANLDVKGDVEAGLKNQKVIEDTGLHPVPVFHGGESWSVLQDMIKDYPYICLGGLTGNTRSGSREMFSFIVKCFQMGKGHSVFHGFGCTNWEVLKSFAWYSVDSSTWGAGFRWGRVEVFDEKKGKFQKVYLGDCKSCMRHSGLIKSLGFDFLDFADRKRNDRAKICAISALSYMMAERWLRKRHGNIAIPRREGADGDRLHLADTSNGTNWGDADKGLKVHLADARGERGGDLAAALNGLKLYQVATAPGQKAEWNAWRSTQPGTKLYLVEHSLDRGGRGY